MTYEPEDSYPVLVTYTITHVVWVEAPDQDAAVEYVDGEAYEYASNDNVSCASTEVKKPDEWDWTDVYYGDNSHTYDAHVRTHRQHLRQVEQEAARAACIEAGHPDLDPSFLGRPQRWCRTCVQYIEPAQAVAS